jgi:hypothetical protein
MPDVSTGQKVRVTLKRRPGPGKSDPLFVVAITIERIDFVAESE